MAIQNRRGNFVDFDPYKMLAGEFAYSLDTEELYYCVSPGNVKRCATKEELVNKVDKVEGKDLSTNDYTDADKQKLDNVQDEIGFARGEYSTLGERLNTEKISIGTIAPTDSVLWLDINV